MLNKRYRFFVNFNYLDKDSELGLLFGVYDFVDRHYCQVVKIYDTSKMKRWTMPSFSLENAEKFAKGYDENSVVFHYASSVRNKIDNYKIFSDVVADFFDYYKDSITLNEMTESAFKWWEYFVLIMNSKKSDPNFISEVNINGNDYFVFREDGKIVFKVAEV